MEGWAFAGIEALPLYDGSQLVWVNGEVEELLNKTHDDGLRVDGGRGERYGDKWLVIEEVKLSWVRFERRGDGVWSGILICCCE